MKILIKRKLKATEEISVHNFNTTENGININGKEINILSKFKPNSYMLVFQTDFNNEELVYVDGKKLRSRGVEGFSELRYVYLIKSFAQQIVSVWYGNTEEDITVVINIPVSFLDNTFEYEEVDAKPTIEILKDIYPEAKELYDSVEEQKELIKEKLLF
jgi:hypothetical protein